MLCGWCVLLFHAGEECAVDDGGGVGVGYEVDAWYWLGDEEIGHLAWGYRTVVTTERHCCCAVDCCCIEGLGWLESHLDAC